MTKIKESRNYTALCYASFKNFARCFNAIYDHAVKYNLAEEKVARERQLKQWVNTPTDEQFTALHFASYHGNITLIKLMVEKMGANVNGG